MAVRLEAVTYATRDPGAVGAFWAGLLGRDPVAEGDAVLVPGTPTQVGLRFIPGIASAVDRLHLHVTSSSADEQRDVVDAVQRLGGRRRGTGDLPFGHDLYLADPDGNEFCLIEPGNSYLAGCGQLGEVTAEGGRATGLFWREALDWNLVWDEGEQTAVQAPAGGTKISWDVSPETPTAGPTRQRFDLVADDPAAEGERLLALGATRRGDLYADPDGTEFTMRRAS